MYLRPIKKLGFYLSESEFWNLICPRQGVDFNKQPSKCECDKIFSTEHNLNFLERGLATIRNNSVLNTNALDMKEIAHDVQVEPCLHELMR